MTGPRRVLQQELATLTRRLAVRAPLPQFAGDLVDQAAVCEGFEFDQRARDRMTARVRALTAALDRMDRGTWGKCELCGDAIGAARLQALPAVEFCLSCQARLERDAARAARRSGRPVVDEEEE